MYFTTFTHPVKKHRKLVVRGGHGNQRRSFERIEGKEEVWCVWYNIDVYKCGMSWWVAIPPDPNNGLNGALIEGLFRSDGFMRLLTLTSKLAGLKPSIGSCT